MGRKYLFLCSMGQNRSPTAAEVAEKIALGRGLKIDMDYNGVDIGEICMETEKLKKKLDDYEKIFVMEERMYNERLRKWGVSRNKVTILHIPDVYERNDSDLIRILENLLKIKGQIE